MFSAEVERRRIRWGARAALWQGSTLFAVRTCGRNLVEDGESVPVKGRVVDGRRVGGYGGLTLCGSVWACPRCSAVVAWQRSAEIARAASECTAGGGRMYFLTLTLRHRSADTAAALWEVLGKAWRGVFGGHGWTGVAGRKLKRGGWRAPELGDRERFGVAGVVRVVEATVSRPGSGGHGWHLHVHAIVFGTESLGVGLVDDWRTRLASMLGSQVGADPEWVGRLALHARIAARFGKAVAAAGGRAPGAAAVDLRAVSDGGAEYIGGYLAKSTYDVATRMAAEVAGVAKDARTVRNLTPFRLLAEAVETEPFGFRTPRAWVIEPPDPEAATARAPWHLIDARSGEATELRPPRLWRLWWEWERASLGKRQIAWSLRPRRDRFTGVPLVKASAVDPERVQELDRMWLRILEARGETAEQTAEELARTDLDGLVLGDIERASWYAAMVRRPSRMFDALEAFESGGASELSAWMRAQGIDYHPR